VSSFPTSRSDGDIPRRVPVRTTFCLLIALVPTLAARSAEESPTPEEQKVIDAVGKLGGRGMISTDQHKEARVLVKIKEINDGTIAKLKAYPQIGGIETFDSRQCTEKGFTTLADFPHLWQLKIGQNRLTDKTLAVIVECKELRLFFAEQGQVTDSGLANLKKLTRLEALDLSGNRAITDAGMVHIKALERLEILYLGDTQLTDKGLFELSGLEGLRTLNVAKTKVTADAAMKFVDLMPNLRAVRR
jgi:hypothetical protein